MKLILLSFFYVCICLFSDAQVSDLIGTWNLKEFTTFNKNNQETKNEERLRGDGAVWNLIFMEDSRFKQTSNMSESGMMDTYEGTWKVSGDNLILGLTIMNRNLELIYNYKIADNNLILERGNPSGTIKIISTFRKKQ